MSRRALAFAGLGLLAACAGAKPVAPPPAPIAAPAPAPVITVAPQVSPPMQGDDFPPSILLPDAAGDDEVARVGDLVLRKSHAFTRLLAADPKLALSAVDLLVFDVLVERHSREFGIHVDAATVKSLAQKEQTELEKQVQTELGSKVTLADYVWRIFGMRLADWQRTTELRIAQRLYQGYVIRFLALREEQVQVRYLVNSDGKLLAELRQKVVEGADFATLAQRWSEDSLRRDGGLLPPFGPGFPHPAAKAAATLRPGEMSPPFACEVGGEKKHMLVWCVSRRPGRPVAFAEVRAEIDADLLQRPLQPLEINSYTLRWRPMAETATGSKGDR